MSWCQICGSEKATVQIVLGDNPLWEDFCQECFFHVIVAHELTPKEEEHEV